MAPLIELRGITKRFGGVTALDDVSLRIEPGEIHCLAGENGSGKSTIIKVISGVYTPDGGEIFIDGKPVGPLSPPASIAHGIQVIYQDFSLFPTLTVAENIVLNSLLKDGRRTINWRAARRAALRPDVMVDRRSCARATSAPGSHRRGGSSCGSV